MTATYTFYQWDSYPVMSVEIPLDYLSACYQGAALVRYAKLAYQVGNRTRYWKNASAHIWINLVDRIILRPEYYHVSLPLVRWLLRTKNHGITAIGPAFVWLNQVVLQGELDDVILFGECIPSGRGIPGYYECLRTSIEIDRPDVAKELIRMALHDSYPIEPTPNGIISDAVMALPTTTYLEMLPFSAYAAAIRKSSMTAKMHMIQYLADQRWITPEWWRSLVVHAVSARDPIRVDLLFQMIREQSNSASTIDTQLVQSLATAILRERVRFLPDEDESVLQSIEVFLGAIRKDVVACEEQLFCLIIEDPEELLSQVHHPILAWILTTYSVDILARDCQVIARLDHHMVDTIAFLEAWFLNHQVISQGSRVHYYGSARHPVIGCSSQLPIYGWCSFQVYGTYIYLPGCLVDHASTPATKAILNPVLVEYPLATDQVPIEIYIGAGYQTTILLQPPQILVDYWSACHGDKKSAGSQV